MWSFRVYYRKTFAREPDLIVRFLKALLASTAPIRDRRLVYEWWQLRRQRSRRRENVHADVATLSA